MARILLIDEDVELRLFHRTLLEGLDDYEIIDVGSAAAAIEVLIREAFDAVVIALDLPDMDGLQFTEVIHAWKPHLPIIINTGDEWLGDYLSRHGARAFIPRACGFPELESTLARVVTGASPVLG